MYTEENKVTPFILEQRDFYSYQTIGDADAALAFKNPGIEVYIISEDRFYYWNPTLMIWVAETTVGPNGESNTASNVGTGTGLFKDKLGVDLRFKSLLGVDSVVITPGTDEVSIGVPTLAPHIADMSNPHNVTATQVGKDIAQWNADRILGVTVDDTNIANGKILKYNSGSGKLEYVDDLDTQTAAEVSYNNLISGLIATNVQDAIDEVEGRVDNLEAPEYHILVVSKVPRVGEFSSVVAAIAAVVAPSATNLWKILVGPGVFTEPEIFLPSYVTIVGSSIETTTIEPDGAHHVFHLQNPVVEISLFGISNAPAGFAGIFVDDLGDFAQCHKITFTDCDINVWVKSVTQDTFFYGEYLDYNGTYSFGTKIEATNNFQAFANLENYYNIPVSGSPIGTYISGVNSRVHVLASGQIGYGAGTAFYVENGGRLESEATNINNWDKGIHVGNAGAASSLLVDGITNDSNVTWDLLIEDPGTTGSVQGIFDQDKISINASSSIGILIQDAMTGAATATNRINVLFPNGTITDISTLIGEGSTSGVLEGGELSDGGGFVVNVADGYGYFEQFPDNDVEQRHDWTSTTITLSANVDQYIYFNSNAILVSNSARPDPRYNIILGRVVTNGTGIELIDASLSDAEHTSNLLSNAWKNALGPIYASGSLVQENVTPFHLDIGSGIFYYGENFFNPSGGTNVTFTQLYRNGIGGFTSTVTNVVNNTNYDNGSGTLASLTAGYYVKHSLYVVGEGVNEKYYLVIADNQYSTLLAAQMGDIPSKPSYIKDSVTLIAGIIIQQGFTNIVQVRDLRPVVGFKSEGVNASADHLSLLNLNTGDAGHHQFLMLDGSKVMTGNLDLGTNNIINVTSIDSIPVTNFYKRNGNAFGSDAIIGLTDAFAFKIRTSNLDRISISSGGVVTISNLAGGGTQVVGADNSGILTVSVTTTNLPEGTNLYYTQARFDTAFAAKTTSDLTEGTNLYFTNARAQAAITGGASSIVTANLTVNRALVSDASGKVVVSVTTDTELSYLSGVTSAIQTQLNNKQPLDSTLTALAAYNTNGFLVQTATDTFVGRSLIAPVAGFTITNNDGVAGNPTFVLSNDLGAIEALDTNGILVRIATDTWISRTVTGTATRISVSNGDGIAGNPTIDLIATAVVPNPYGSATQVGTFTVDAYGRLTTAANVTITPAASSITNGQPLTKVDDTNVTLTLGGTPATALLQSVSLTLGWTGILAVARGGTGVSTFGGTNRLLYTTTTDTLSSITTANTSALVTNSTGVPSWTSGGTANRILRTDGTTISFSQVVLTTDVSGILPEVNGGTNQSTYTTGDTLYASASNTLSKLPIGTTGQVLTVIGGIPTWAAVSAGEITLTNNHILIGNASNIATDVAMSGDATIVASGALTLATVNATTGTFGSATQVAQVTVNAKGLVTAVSNITVTPAASSITGGQALTKTDDTNVTLTLGGTPATALLQSVSLTLGWTGLLSLARGGTNANLTASNGAIVYSTATALALSTVGSTGQVLQSNGAAAPTWSTPTYPSTSGTTGKILRSNGTNNIYSTSTFADTYTASNLLYSNGANTVTGLATANNGVLITSGTGVPSISSTLPSAVQLNITSTGTVTAGTWSSTIIVADNVFTIQDDGDTTKQLQFQLSGITTATTRTLTIPDISAVITVRDAVQRQTLTTTNNTATTIITIPTVSNAGYLLEVRAVSRRVSGTGAGTNGDTNSYVRTVSIKNVAGTITINTVQSSYTDEDIAAHNVTITSSGTNILVQVAGSTNNTVNWVALSEIITV